MVGKIVIKGAREHNLKNIDLELPKNQLIIFAGISGSGKSSLAFDTIYAEGQRRYVESLSSYARQFLGVMDKPDVDSIEGLSPAISIDQKTTSHNPRSTVGTITEIYDYLRLLFARVGHPHCQICGTEIERQSVSQIVEKILLQIEKTKEGKIIRFLILSPVVRERKGEFKELFANLKSKGFSWVRIDNHLFSLNEDLVLLKNNKHTIEVVIDRVSLETRRLGNAKEKESLRKRLIEAVEIAVSLSGGLVTFSQVRDKSFVFPEKPKEMKDSLFSEKFACPKCNITLSEIEPRLFSFNSPLGACPTCAGIGSLLRIDPQLVLNPNLSISEGAILPFARLIFSDTWFGRLLLVATESIGIKPNQPLKNVSPEKLNLLLYGTGEKIYPVTGTNRHGRVVTIYETFPGVIPELEKRWQEAQSEYIKNEIGKYLREEICPSCLGKRLKKEALSVVIDDKNIADVSSFSIKELLGWIKELEKKFSPKEKAIADLIVREIIARLTFLCDVGLEYLTLERKAASLAGGESQRIRLASQIGSGLTGVLYILDEPSIGLHPRDTSRLIATLEKLRNLGNTVIVVEHDREILESADYIVEFGPKAGEEGGKVVFQGTVEKIKKSNFSLTGQFLAGKRKIQIQKKASFSTETRWLKIFGCRGNNLKNLDIFFPLKNLICVTGVSGSGKSTLVVDTLYHALASYFNPYHREKPLVYQKLEGQNYLKRVLLIDQSPIGRTPRSNPATYTGAFTYIRDLFAQTPEAKLKGYTPSRFSFNVKGGRCESCSGEGQLKIEMQFLPDIYVKCDSCAGKRFNAETLEVYFKGKNIAEILEMTVEEALAFFVNIPGLFDKLATLKAVGLSYMRLGQPATTLSGGEAQRVKLATELAKKSTRDTLYILDEPTTGLHFADLEKLLYVLRELVEMGNTVIVIEHNLDVIKNADWIIDLGPEGGERGGYLVAAGTVQEIRTHPSSHTGKYLR